MTMDEWREQLDRIPGLWPGRKPLPEAAVKAWFDELGRFTDRELFDALLSRLALSAERAPGLAALSMAVRDAGGSRKRKEDEPENPEDRERWNRVGRDWTLIISCLHDPGVAGVYWTLMGADDPKDRAKCMAALQAGGEADPGDLRLILLEEIRERGVTPEFRKPVVARGGGFVTIGQTLGGTA